MFSYKTEKVLGKKAIKQKNPKKGGIFMKERLVVKGRIKKIKQYHLIRFKTKLETCDFRNKYKGHEKHIKLRYRTDSGARKISEPYQ